MGYWSLRKGGKEKETNAGKQNAKEHWGRMALF
jgi:hypothetical protein